MSDTFIIKPSLVVKAESQDAAIKFVKQHLTAKLQEWFADSPNDVPFPDGTLLHWDIWAAERF